MFAVVLKYLKPLETIDALRPAHVQFLKKYYAAGNLIVSGGQVPRTGGFILAQADSKEALWEILKEDPFHQEQAAAYEVFEFNPTLHAEGFAPFL